MASVHRVPWFADKVHINLFTGYFAEVEQFFSFGWWGKDWKMWAWIRTELKISKDWVSQKYNLSSRLPLGTNNIRLISKTSSTADVEVKMEIKIELNVGSDIRLYIQLTPNELPIVQIGVWIPVFVTEIRFLLCWSVNGESAKIINKPTHK